MFQSPISSPHSDNFRGCVVYLERLPGSRLQKGCDLAVARGRATKRQKHGIILDLFARDWHSVSLINLDQR